MKYYFPRKKCDPKVRKSVNKKQQLCMERENQ